jgi:hypothetical protein
MLLLNDLFTIHNILFIELTYKCNLNQIPKFMLI